MASTPGSLLRRTTWSVPLALAAFLLLPAPAGARPFLLPADDTPPIVSFSIDGVLGTNDWYRGRSGGFHYIVLHWSVSDPESPILSTSGCEPAIRIDSPDTGHRWTCTATSDGGTTSVTTRLLKVDAEPPTNVQANAARPTDHNGWYNHAVGVNWGGTDVTSGIASCTSRTYSGPDVANGTTSGTCTDMAGNVSPTSNFSLSYDGTRPNATNAAPARGTDHDGWYNHAVAISWSGNDATSGIDSCTSRTYNGPDADNGTTSGTCTDEAGNTSTALNFTLDYDATMPNVLAAAAARPPDRNGWYNHAVGITWSGNDAMSGIDSCTSRSYSGPDVDNGTTSGTCTDVAGNTSTALGFTLDYDATAPAVSVAAARSPDHNGWYNHALGVSWSGTDAMSGMGSCSQPVTYSGPDSGSASSTGSCSDRAGNSASLALTFSYDDTAPTTSAGPSRPPNGAGWYRAPLSITWNGVDATSGVDTCRARLDYSGPDTTGADQTGSCSDVAGNSSSATFRVKYDATAPTVTGATPSRPPDHNGWYNHSLAISWSGTDAMSGIASCTSSTYNGPDSATARATGGCTDAAGNSANLDFGFEYDATAPAVSVTPARSADDNGWYNHSLRISWSGTDSTSGVDSCSVPLTYTGPDRSDASAAGSCADVAGNSASRTLSFSYDDTSPTTVATPSRAPNAAGWYRAPLSITWSGTDGASGIDSCHARLDYAGPDTAGTDESGNCTDVAGNTSSDSFRVRYDTVAPTASAAATRPPNAAGWYNAPVRIDWSGTDQTSGIASCTSRTYTGPDVANGSASGSCIDAAGNMTGVAFPLSYDATDPVVTVGAARNPDHAGWYNHPVRISWSGTDATSGIASCSPPVNYGGPDSSNASSGGGCTDRAGNSASPPALAFKYDATAPVTSAVPSRRADASGWYNHPLRIDWRGSDPASGVASCTSQGYNGPDAGSVGKSGACSDKAGNTSAPVAFDFRYDATAPRGLAVSPDRQPDHDGWYNHPLAVRWSASDGLAGIASCTSLAYAGPDVNRTDLAGSCSDRAGNVSGPLRFALSYDATAPAFKLFSLKALDDVVALRWRLSGAKDLRIMRSPGMSKTASSAVYQGAGSAFTDRRVENYVRYRYTLTAEDAAGNTVTRRASAKPMPALFAPRPGAHVRAHASRFFAWRPVPRARYYNMQLWLDGRAVGAWWPLKARMKLPLQWRFRGERHRLEPGNYTWYVWPGRGPRKLGRYGPLVGKSTFVAG